MKILKIFGIVVGIHVFALILIFANPGCSSSTKPPVPADTATVAAPSPAMVTPSPAPAPPPTASPASSAPITFNPDAPAVGSSSSSGPSVRYTPTRPGTPVATTLVTEPVPDVMPATTYTIKSGDSLWTVAKKHNLTVAQLAAANHLQASAKLQPGQKLLIPGKPASPASAATTAPSPAPAKSTELAAARPATGSTTSGSGQLKHTVKNGEALSTIAKTYGVSLKELAIANNIPDPAKVKAGTELVIPGWDTSPSKSGKSTKSGSAKASSAPATKSAPVPPPTVNVDAQPAQPGPPPVPVIDIERGSPIVPAPKGP